MIELEDFDKFIEQNRDEFDVMEPSAGVWDRIEKKTNKVTNRTHKTVRLNWIKIVSNVAAGVAIFIASYLFHEWNSKDAPVPAQAVASTQDSIPQLFKEFTETEAFFVSQVNGKLDEIHKYQEEYPELIEEILSDFKALDVEYNNLKKDLHDNASNQAIIQAMVQNQRIKLDILENLLEELNKKLNNESNEGYQDEDLQI